MAGVCVRGGGLDGEMEIAAADLKELDTVGLIRRHRFNTNGTFQFDVTREGREYVQAIRQRGEPLEREQTVVG